ncbi:MAG: helix-turn-helix transcriptional regulator [Longicatena sp.]
MELMIGKKLKKLRTLKAYTQEDIASLCNVSNVAVSKWENNITYPDITTLPILARIFDVSIDELLSFEKLLSDSEVKQLGNETLELFQTKSFDEAFSHCKELIHDYPNNELLKITLSGISMSVTMLCYPQNEANAEKYMQFAEELSREVTHSSLLQYKQTAIVQLVSFLSLKNNVQEALDLLQTLPKISNTTSLEVSLYYQQKEYQKAKKIAQQQLYVDFNNLAMNISTLINIANQENNKEEMRAYIHLMEQLDTAFQLPSSTSNQLFAQYAKLEDKENTLRCLKVYIQQMLNFDTLFVDTEKKLSNNPFFYSIDIKNNAFPKGVMKTTLKPMLSEMKELNFLKEDKEYQELLASLK